MNEIIEAARITLINFGVPLLFLVGIFWLCWYVFTVLFDNGEYKKCPSCGQEVKKDRYMEDWDRMGRSYYCSSCLKKF